MIAATQNNPNIL